MDFNVKLKFDYTNAWGTKIYNDLMQRHVYKIGKCLTPFEKLSWVNYQGDMYIGEDGSRYESTLYPKNADVMGMLHDLQSNPQKDDEHYTGQGSLQGPCMSTFSTFLLKINLYSTCQMMMKGKKN